jgi:hypothetical protein
MGPYDNETGEHMNPPGYLDGHWYVGEDDDLYIVPNAVTEIEGPDDLTLEALNKIYRESDFTSVDPEEVAGNLNLTFVYDVHRRFSTSLGFWSEQRWSEQRAQEEQRGAGR